MEARLALMVERKVGVGAPEFSVYKVKLEMHRKKSYFFPNAFDDHAFQSTLIISKVSKHCNANLRRRRSPHFLHKAWLRFLVSHCTVVQLQSEHRSEFQQLLLL